jgi:anhydro-N-acetylmuramic acid kinase
LPSSKAGFIIKLNKKQYIVAGLMSGTSLDGVDIAICSFRCESMEWKYELLHSKTYSYEDSWKKTLAMADNIPGDRLVKLDREYGDLLGNIVKNFIGETKVTPELIASHGHTIFHRPEEGFSFQIGHGAHIACITGIDVVNDFRTSDMARGGQGAPLVPFGDKALFGHYGSCLNLGGFSNISFDAGERRIAFDICPVNILLNHLALEMGFDYDHEGTNGRSGKCDNDLLKELNGISYYRKKPPKSLGREWVAEYFLPVMKKYNLSLPDKLNTVYRHITDQIVTVIDEYGLKSVFITGGGAYNTYLIELLKEKTNARIIIPDKKTVEYKEAIIFAFMGLMRYLNKTNCLASVTGALNNSVCGGVFKGK